MTPQKAESSKASDEENKDEGNYPDEPTLEEPEAKTKSKAKSAAKKKAKAKPTPKAKSKASAKAKQTAMKRPAKTLEEAPASPDSTENRPAKTPKTAHGKAKAKAKGKRVTAADKLPGTRVKGAKVWGKQIQQSVAICFAKSFVHTKLESNLSGEENSLSLASQTLVLLNLSRYPERLSSL